MFFRIQPSSSLTSQACIHQPSRYQSCNWMLPYLNSGTVTDTSKLIWDAFSLTLLNLLKWLSVRQPDYGGTKSPNGCKTSDRGMHWPNVSISCNMSCICRFGYAAARHPHWLCNSLMLPLGMRQPVFSPNILL